VLGAEFFNCSLGSQEKFAILDKNGMNKKILILIILAVIAIIAIFVFQNIKSPPQVNPAPVIAPPITSEPTINTEPPPAPPEPSPASPKSSPVPAETSSSKLELTPPDQIYQLREGSDAKFRVFNITISKDGFKPNKIVVNQGDGVQFNLRALDGTYDLYIRTPRSYIENIEAGKLSQIGFEVSRAGTFGFQCRDKCPSGGLITGEIVVLPK